MDTGPYRKDRVGYRKRTGPAKLLVKLPLVEERLDIIVRTHFAMIKFLIIS